MANAADRNFALRERAKQRRLALSLDSPGTMGTVAPDVGWDSFFLGLQEQGERANAAGMRHRVDPSGFGRQGTSLASMGRPGDDDVVRNWAANTAAGELIDQRKLRDQSLRAMTAQNDMIDAEANDRAAIDRAVATANTPGVSQFGKPIVQTAPGSYATTVEPEPGGPGGPVDRQAVLRQQLPGHLQKPEPPAPALTFKKPEPMMVGGKRQFVREGSDGQMYGLDRKPIDPNLIVPEDPPVVTSTDPLAVEAPTDPDSQDIMSQAGLGFNAFKVLTGGMSQLPRDRVTRERASQEVQAWARKRGMDVSTFASQYKAYNETLENNIQRYNRTVLAEGEIGADVENLLASVKKSGLGDVRAVNAAKQWLKGELNDPNAAEYAFYLNQLTNDIALYNAASQGRATLQADTEEAKSVVQRGIATGSLNGLQEAITQSVNKMGTVLEASVDRSRKNVWDLFGVGDKYKPVTKARGGGNPEPPGGGNVPMLAPDGRPLSVPAADVDRMLGLGAKRAGGA